MTNIAKKISWLTPLALFVSLPASAVPISIAETIDNPGFEILDQWVELDDAGNVDELEVEELWTSTAHPRVHKTITIDYAHETSLADPFEIEFIVYNDTPRDWSGYSFTFSGLGDLNLSDVLVDWENEIDDIDDNPAFLSSAIVGDKLGFHNGAHASGGMVAYELYFDPAALAQAEISEIGVVQAVPLPAAAWLMIGGLGMLVGFAKKRKSA